MTLALSQEKVVCYVCHAIAFHLWRVLSISAFQVPSIFLWVNPNAPNQIPTNSNHGVRKVAWIVKCNRSVLIDPTQYLPGGTSLDGAARCLFNVSVFLGFPTAPRHVCLDPNDIAVYDFEIVCAHAY